MFLLAGSQTNISKNYLSGAGKYAQRSSCFCCKSSICARYPLLGILARGKPHVWLARHDVLEKFFLIRFIVPRVAIIVDTTTPRTAMVSLLSIIKIAQQENRHVMIFPEGGRFTNGTVQEFYGGFALLVRRLGRPVIPVYIQGVDIVYPPTSWWAYPAPIAVTVGAPMMPEPDEDDTQFKERVHRWFLTQA